MGGTPGNWLAGLTEAMRSAETKFQPMTGPDFDEFRRRTSDLRPLTNLSS